MSAALLSFPLARAARVAEAGAGAPQGDVFAAIESELHAVLAAIGMARLTALQGRPDLKAQFPLDDVKRSLAGIGLDLERVFAEPRA